MDRAEFKQLDKPQKFKIMYGVDKEELRQKGIDPDEYAAEHVQEVLKDPVLRALVLDPDQLLKTEYIKRLGRVWVCNFAGLGFLFTTFIPYPYSRPIGIALAFVCVVMAFVFVVIALRAKHRWKQACKAKGIKARL